MKVNSFNNNITGMDMKQSFQTGKNEISGDKVILAGEGQDDFLELQDMIQKLKQDNEQLRKEIGELKEKKEDKHIHMDFKEGAFTIRDIEHKGFNLEYMKIKNKVMEERSDEINSDILFSRKPEELRSGFFEIMGGPFTVEEGKVSVTAESLTEMLKKVDEFEKNDCYNMKAAFEDGKCQLKGEYTKLFHIPFTMDYSISFEEGKLKIHTDKVEMAGGLPVPDLLLPIITNKFIKGIIENDETDRNTLSINMGALVPVEFEASISGIKAEKGTLTVELGPGRNEQ